MTHIFKARDGLLAYVFSLWMLVQEPRKQSVAYFIVYLITTAMGALVFFDPPRSMAGTIGQTMVIVWAAMMGVGGLTGLLTVLPGWWWLERAGTWLCIFATGIYGLAMWALPISQVSLRLATMLFMFLGLMVFVVRLLKTRHYSYDPEK